MSEESEVAGCEFNETLSELVNLTAQSSPEWNIDCTSGVWESSPSIVSKNCKNWFGWSGNDNVGSISTILKESGRAELDFGNCHTSGVVTAFIGNGKYISKFHR